MTTPREQLPITRDLAIHSNELRPPQHHLEQRIRPLLKGLLATGHRAARSLEQLVLLQRHHAHVELEHPLEGVGSGQQHPAIRGLLKLDDQRLLRVAYGCDGAQIG